MVTLLGLQTTLARLAQVLVAGQAAGEAAKDAVSDFVGGRMRDLVAVDTGATRDSIEETGAGIVVGGAWPYLEFGTYKMSSQPFIRPAADEARNADMVTPARAALLGGL